MTKVRVVGRKHRLLDLSRSEIEPRLHRDKRRPDEIGINFIPRIEEGNVSRIMVLQIFAFVLNICLLWGIVSLNLQAQTLTQPKILFNSDRDGNTEIYVMNADGTNVINLTNHPATDQEHSWSPDGQKIAFSSDRSGNWEIYVMNADGTNVTNLTNHPMGDGEPAWSPDGRKIAFSSARDGGFEIYVMNADGTNPVNLTNHPGAGDFNPSWSFDGRKIAFVSDRDGFEEIYVMDANGKNQKRLTDNLNLDLTPSWSPDSQKIVFSSSDGKILRFM